MSHPLQADNYSVSDGERWRVGYGTGWGIEGVGERVEQHDDSSPTCSTHIPPRQHACSNPLPAVWRRAQEWQGDTGSFFMCCSSTPLQSNCEQHLCFTTTRRPLTGRKRGKPELRSDINHSAADNCCQTFDCFLVIFKPLVSLSLLVTTYVESKTEMSKYKSLCLWVDRLSDTIQQKHYPPCLKFDTRSGVEQAAEI